MLGNVFGLIYTGEENMQLRDLTNSRSVAAVPIGGRYRCIDFILSNLVNTGISNVGLIAQKNYHSLMDHLGSGKEWDLHRKRDGLFILPPFLSKENTGLYRGTVDAYRSVMGYVRRSPQRYVILTGSHTVFNTTFDDMLRQHINTGADITIMYNRVKNFNPDDQYDDMRLTLDDEGRVTDIEYNPYRPTSDCQACDVFVMEKELLEYLIEEAAARDSMDFIRDIVMKKFNTLKVYGWGYDGFVARINSLDCYYKHNMEMLKKNIREDLFCAEHPIYTKVKDEVPAVYGKNSKVKNSLIADGCSIEGEVEDSIIFRGVKIGEGTKIKGCIIMQACNIESGTELDHVILDKGVTVRQGRRLAGYDGFPVIIRKNSTI